MEASRLLKTLDLFSAEVESAADNLGLQSACSDWTIGQVIRHVTYVQRELTLPLLRGEEPGALLGTLDISDFEAAEEWRKTAAHVRAAAEHPAAQLTDKLTLPLLDTTIHAWDIRAGLVRVGLAEPLELDPATLGWMEAFKKYAPEELIRRERMFGPALDVPADTSPTAKFMAWAGRPM